MLKTVTDADFDEQVIAASRPVLVDFWADWCGPCKALAPTLDDLAGEYESEIDVAKVDIVANAETARRLEVRSIPLLVLFRDGQEIARSVGGMSRTRLAAFIEEHSGISA